ELGEIEAALCRQTGVDRAAVAVRQPERGGAELVAYIVWKAQEQNVEVRRDLRAVEQSLRSELPDYMVPALWMELPELPLSAHGKVNRKALPESGTTAWRRGQASAGWVGPRNSVEAALATIWAQVLGVERLGIYDNFFHLGGDSILSIQIVARAQQAGLRLTVRQVFQYPTLEGLARVAEVRGTLDGMPPERAEGAAVLTPIQRRFLEREMPEAHHYNQAVLGELSEQVMLEQVRRIAVEWLRHHDAFRLRLRRHGIDWEQVHAGVEEPLPLSYIDLRGVPAAQQRAVAQAAAQTQSSLDLEAGPLLRLVWMERGSDQRALLLLVVHHWVMDGVSWRVLLEEFQTAQGQLQRGEPTAWPAPSASFQRWGAELERYAQSAELRRELGYWLEQGQGPSGQLPLDSSAGPNSMGSTRRVTVELDAAETHSLLQQVPEAYRTQLPEVLLTALVQALEEWTGSAAWKLDLEGHGREELDVPLDVSRTVGWFTSVYPVKLVLAAQTGPGAALKSIKEQLRAVPRHG
ncbi:MAG: condensation domain-containing protein, partial [Chloroflexota bacterium]